MSRSSYIYIVLINGELHSAATVKYEMEQSLPKKLPNNIQIFRISDGIRNLDGNKTDITKEIIDKLYK